MRVAWYRIARRVLILVILGTALLFYFQGGWRTLPANSVPQREGKQMSNNLPLPIPSQPRVLPNPANRTARPVKVPSVTQQPPVSDNGLITLRNNSREEHSFRRNDHFVPSKCSGSLQKRLWATAWTSGTFHPEINQLLTTANLNRAEHQRLAKYWMPFGFKYHENMTYDELVKVVQLVPETDSIFEFSKSKPRPRCLTCAVVGNGGILNGSRMGKEIDGHDMVFRGRVNHCIRRGYEEDVGTRTTHLFLMDRSLTNTKIKDIPKDKGIKYVFLTCRKNDYRYIKTATTSNSSRTKLRIKGSDARILHPDFVRYTHKVWENTPSFRPTTGGMMFFTALHAGCDQVSVYGMGFTRNFTEHYYDKEFVRFKYVTKSHDFKREVNILSQLDRDGIINWYKRERAPKGQGPAGKT